MNRQEANRLILQRISELIEEHPDLRFHQILFTANLLRIDPQGYVEDDFYLESVEALKNLK